jgi:hypothetical protein
VASDVSFDILPASLAPANDAWSQALPIPSVGAPVVGTNLYATRESGEPRAPPNAAGRSVWWSWQASVNGTVTATTAGSSFDTVLAVYQGTSLATLALLNSNDDAGPGSNVFSQVSFNPQAGTNYYFIVDSALAPNGSSGGGEVQLRIVEGAPPAVSIAAPENGRGFLVPSLSLATNVTAALSLSGPSGIERVEYSLDGDLPAPRTGMVSPPYQWTLADLSPGEYWLLVTATGSNGLLSTAHTGFSVASLAPSVRLVDLPGTFPGGLPLGVTGLKGTNYTLQNSSNLVAWSDLKRWTNFPGAERVIDTNGQLGGARFYRAAFP